MAVRFLNRDEQIALMKDAERRHADRIRTLLAESEVVEALAQPAPKQHETKYQRTDTLMRCYA